MDGQLVESRGVLTGEMLGLQLEVMRAGAAVKYAAASYAINLFPAPQFPAESLISLAAPIR